MRRQGLKCMKLDDIQWQEEYKDGDVLVAHWERLPELPNK